MQEVKKVINRDQQVIASDGAVVTERAQSVKTEAGTKTTISNIIWYLYGLIAIVLAIRFVLKLTGANAANSFVSFVYSVSGFFSKPFDTIFGAPKSSAGNVTSVFEPSILVAIVVYGLVAWGVAKLLTLNEAQD